MQRSLRRRSFANPRGGCILAYHRVADLRFVDPRLDDWNVVPAMFDRQIDALKRCADIVPLNELLLAARRTRAQPAGGRPDFRRRLCELLHQVLPILKRHGVPATVFVVTSLIDSKDRRRLMPGR